MSVDGKLLVDELVRISNNVSEVSPFYCIVVPISVGLLGFFTFKIYKSTVINNNLRNAREIHKKKMSSAEARIKEQLGTAEDIMALKHITDMSWEQLSQGLGSGELTPSQVLRSYQARALEVHSTTNCVVSWIEEAVEWAEVLDNVSPGARGPLYGVPVSVKECYAVAGTDSTAGLLKFFGQPSSVNAAAVDMIKSLGGVPFCKTNVPQAMYSMQCSNPLFGVTTNMTGREPGGSSGGEGALIGGGGSILGIGNDVGGSLRNPAAFCGIYSMRPTFGRHLTQNGSRSPTDHEPVGIPVVGGFMSSSAACLEHCWRNTLGLTTKDTGILPIPWRDQLFNTKPKIGYFTQDDFLSPAPGAKRAVTEAVAHLRSAGYDVVEFSSPPMEKMIYLFNGIVLADEARPLNKNIEWDKTDSTLYGLLAAITVYSLPWIIKKFLVGPLVAAFTKVKPVEALFKSTSDLQAGLAMRDRLARDYLDKMEEANVDIIITPGQMMPAPPTGEMGLFVPVILPYIAWNVLNFPAGIAPVTSHTSQDMEALDELPNNDLVYTKMRDFCKGTIGLPLSVQVVGRPYHEEQVLKIMGVLEEAQK